MGLARSFHMFLQGIFFWQTMNSSKWYWSKVLLKKHWACSFKPGPTIVQPLKLEKSLCNSKRGYVTWRDVVWLKERLLDFMEVLWLDERLLDLSRGCMSWGEITWLKERLGQDIYSYVQYNILTKHSTWLIWSSSKWLWSLRKGTPAWEWYTIACSMTMRATPALCFCICNNQCLLTFNQECVSLPFCWSSDQIGSLHKSERGSIWGIIHVSWSAG